MTIEKSPSPSANATSSAPSANRTEGKKSGADEGSGGFGAILGAIDNAPAAPDTTTDAAANANANTNGKATANSKNAKTDSKTKPAADASAIDPNTLLQQNPQIAAAQAQAAADAATAAAAAATAAALHPQATGTAVADPATLAQQAAAQSQSNPLPTALPGQAAAGAARARGTPGASDSTVALDSANSATPTAAQSLLQAHTKAGKEALQAGADASSQAATTSSSQATAQATASERADAAKFLASLQQAQSVQGGRSEQTALASLVAKSDKPQTERSSSSVKSTDPTYSGTALGVSSPDFSPSTTQVNAVPPEMQVAEQVSYWVSHNVQNAELKLDGLGQDPVAVSISVQGNEAQIAFRSDESATRDMLQNSSAHLKDMLQREGLVLTGVSVGSSGSEGAQGREQGGRQNLRQTQIAPLQVNSQDGTPRARSGMVSGAGRSVDLFV